MIETKIKLREINVDGKKLLTLTKYEIERDDNTGNLIKSKICEGTIHWHELNTNDPEVRPVILELKENLHRRTSCDASNKYAEASFSYIDKEIL